MISVHLSLNKKGAQKFSFCKKKIKISVYYTSVSLFFSLSLRVFNPSLLLTFSLSIFSPNYVYPTSQHWCVSENTRNHFLLSRQLKKCTLVNPEVFVNIFISY